MTPRQVQIGRAGAALLVVGTVGTVASACFGSWFWAGASFGAAVVGAFMLGRVVKLSASAVVRPPDEP